MERIKQVLLQIFTWWNGQTLGTRVWTWWRGEFVGEDEFGNRTTGRRRASPPRSASAAG
jgi:NADH:ubiquinone oxidoreductase subunit